MFTRPSKDGKDNKRNSKNFQQIIGNGTFGEVFKAIDQQNNEVVAIKKVFQDKRYKNREHQIIQEISHPNCVNLIDQYFTQGKNVTDIFRRMKCT